MLTFSHTNSWKILSNLQSDQCAWCNISLHEQPSSRSTASPADRSDQTIHRTGKVSKCPTSCSDNSLSMLLLNYENWIFHKGNEKFLIAMFAHEWALENVLVDVNGTKTKTKKNLKRTWTWMEIDLMGLCSQYLEHWRPLLRIWRISRAFRVSFAVDFHGNMKFLFTFCKIIDESLLCFAEIYLNGKWLEGCQLIRWCVSLFVDCLCSVELVEIWQDLNFNQNVFWVWLSNFPRFTQDNRWVFYVWVMRSVASDNSHGFYT